MCHNHVNPAALRGRQQHLFFFPFHTQTRLSVMFTEWARQCMRQRLEQGTGLSWLCLPVATVTDVLFNTRAGRSSGWSGYKVAHCLQKGECTANVASKHFTCKLITLQLGLGHLCFLCYVTYSWKEK